MPVTSNDLWRLLRQSRLLSAQRLDQVRKAFTEAGNQPEQVPAKALAQWLQQRQMLTPYQARVLLNGRTGPFHYGDYQIHDRIRSGRLGRLFVAVHTRSRFSVLLKFAGSPIAQDPRQWNSARRYVRASCPIRHDQLQHVFSLEDQGGHRFLVLERLTGMSLAEYATQRGALSVSEACRAVRLAALGLTELHSQGQVHGDVRPENLWLESRDNVKLLRDRFLPPTVPAFWQNVLTGTQLDQVDFLAPELGHPEIPLSAATDIYALGCTLYFLMQGHVPYPGGEASDRLRRHAQAPIPPVEAQPLPDGLTELVALLLAKQPGARPQDTAEVAERLLPYIAAARHTVPVFAPTATQLAFEEALAHPNAPIPPAPPPVISAPDDHPQLTEPPIQVSEAPPPHMTQAIEPELDALTQRDGPPAGPPIDVAAQPRRPTARQRRYRLRQARRRQAIVLTAVAALVLVLGGGIVAFVPSIRHAIFGKPPVARVEPGSSTTKANSPRPNGDARGKRKTPSGESTARFVVRPDDGELLWMPPTSGDPVELSYLAPGAQFLLIARPQAIVKSPHGASTLKALGPEFEAARRSWEAAAGYPLDKINQLVIGFHSTSAEPLASMTVTLRDAEPMDRLLDAWGKPAAIDYAGAKYYVAGDWAYYVPDQEEIVQFVMAPESLVREVVDTRDAPPFLRREMARLLQQTDRRRHLSLLFAPDFLAQDQLLDTPFAIDLRLVNGALAWLLGDDVKACLLSMQWDETFYVELRVYGLTGVDSERVAKKLRQRIDEIPNKIELVLAQVYPAIYWRRVALRFPEMVRFLQKYTRIGVEDNQAIVNAVLPGQASHNLVFAGEMMLGTEGGALPDDAAQPPSTAAVPSSLDQLLTTRMNLSFAQKSLEFAVEDLASDIREAYPSLPFPFDIQIMGTDLQLNGITRNQQISEFAAENQTIAEILTAIVMRANPVTTVTSPAEPDQKLIWVVGPDPADAEKQILLITTRDAAQREGYKLPSPFLPE